MKHLIDVRIRTAALESSAQGNATYTDNPHVFAYKREHPRGRMLCLSNFSEQPQTITGDSLWQNGFSGAVRNILGPAPMPLPLVENRLYVAPYESLWLLEEL